MWCYRVALLPLLFPVIVAIKVSPKAYHSNAEESALSNFMNKNKPKAGHVEFQEAKEDISWLISDLRSYVCNNSFNYGQFLLEKDEFWKEFLDIEFLAEKECIKEEKELNVQLKFARHMLNTMVYSAEKMQRYTGINIPGQALIFKMLELNVRLLAVHNLDGTIDCWDETKMVEMLDTYLFEGTSSVLDDLTGPIGFFDESNDTNSNSLFHVFDGDLSKEGCGVTRLEGNLDSDSKDLPVLSSIFSNQVSDSESKLETKFDPSACHSSSEVEAVYMTLSNI